MNCEDATVPIHMAFWCVKHGREIKDCIWEAHAALKPKFDELLKAADALLGHMGGPHTPVCPEYEDEFVRLELLVAHLKGTDIVDETPTETV